MHWAGGAGGRGIVCAGDILTVATDRKWLSFMRSYPNFIPLSAREVEHIGKALAPFQFDMIYGHYFDRVIAGRQAGAGEIGRALRRGDQWDEGVLELAALVLQRTAQIPRAGASAAHAPERKRDIKQCRLWLMVARRRQLSLLCGTGVQFARNTILGVKPGNVYCERRARDRIR